MKNWISCNERTPIIGDRVIATVKHSEWISDYNSNFVPEDEKVYRQESIDVCYAKYIGGKIWIYLDEKNGWVYCDEIEEEERGLGEVCNTIIAWMPLPDPYKEDEK